MNNNKALEVDHNSIIQFLQNDEDNGEKFKKETHLYFIYETTPLLKSHLHLKDGWANVYYRFRLSDNSIQNQNEFFPISFQARFEEGFFANEIRDVIGFNWIKKSIEFF